MGLRGIDHALSAALVALALAAGCSSSEPGDGTSDAAIEDARAPNEDASAPGEDATPAGEDATPAGEDATAPGTDAEPAPDATSGGRDATASPDAMPRDAGSRDAGGGGGSARPLGTVTNVQTGVACGSSGVPSGATCSTMIVHCPGIPDLQAWVAVSRPSGTAHGTIYAHQGSGGIDFYVSNIPQFLQAGFAVAQVRWASTWFQTPLGIVDGGCRPATLMQWVFDNVHNQSRTQGFCAIGHSGGSGALAYSLSHYGMESVLDYASLGAGPPFGRIDCGCAPQTCPGPYPLCPQLQDAVVELPGGMDAPENTTSCRDPNPLPQDLAKWAADSVVSPTGDYDYPDTVVDFYDCTNMPNGTTGGAYFFSNAITSQREVTCFTAADGCANEGVGSVGNAAILADMIAKCIPRH